jgi:hypothetical protein
VAMTSLPISGGFSFCFSISLPAPGKVINVLVLEILPYDFLLDNETENTKSTLKTEYE